MWRSIKKEKLIKYSNYYKETILSEVNIDYTYKDCTLIDKLDNLLELNGFKKINQYIWTDHTYGDAIYIKSHLIV